MVRPGSVLEVGQLVGPVSGLYIVCMYRRIGGVENDSKHSKLQLRVSDMDEMINHTFQAYFISPATYVLKYILGYTLRTAMPIHHVGVSINCTCFEMHRTFLTVISLTS